MLQQTYFTVLIVVATISVGTAGTITNGKWSPSVLGIAPVVPVIELSSVDAYNKMCQGAQ
jgi:hypothetical protein